MKRNHKLAIIGGGFCGVAAAVRLRKKFPSADITIFERDDRLLGLGTGFREANWQSGVERYYHHWFTSDSAMLGLLTELGLRPNAFFKDLLTVMQTRQHGFVQLDSPIALLRFPEISILGRIRMAACLAYLKFFGRWQALEQHTAFAWCTRWMGKAGFEALWQPLLEGKFGPDYARRINMAWLWSRLVTRTKQLGSYRGGFLKLAEDLVEVLAKHNIKVQLGCTNLKFEGGTVYQGTQSLGQFDATLVATGPLALQAIAGASLPSELMQAILNKPFLGVRCLIYSLKEPLNQRAPFYWYSLRKSAEQPFLAMIEHTHFFSAKEFNGEHLVYLASYHDKNSAEAKWSDATWHAAAMRMFKTINPNFDETLINRKWIFDEAYAQPIMDVKASMNLPPLRIDPVTNLYYASMAHVYPWDRGTNFAVDLGNQVAELMANDLADRA